MPQSLANIIVHLVFSTKDRSACLGPNLRPSLHAYLATVARNAGCDCPRVGGVADHVHPAVRLSRTVTVEALVEVLKTSSSKWLKSESPDLGGFAWQRGYGAFSLGQADFDSLLAYIDNQQEHHRTRTFQDEYRMFLDERFPGALPRAVMAWGLWPVTTISSLSTTKLGTSVEKRPIFSAVLVAGAISRATKDRKPHP